MRKLPYRPFLKSVVVLFENEHSCAPCVGLDKTLSEEVCDE
jgi:hypothetical protein